ncbi:hypothetical protein B0H10DRAFT_651589 [Mycena sp. CBHHK59/15]|nr:hypothetical protein B0H10DRAFT_651589 [Mycena sp. CBHHK59/15]
MDDEPHLDHEYNSESTPNDDGSPQFDLHGNYIPVTISDCTESRWTGAFFRNAQNFVLAGGNFTSVMNIKHAAPAVPTDFRVIPVGDLDLRNELRLDRESGVVHRRHGWGAVRRMYSARIHGCKSSMTVAVYQGDNSEEDWQQDISRYSWLRHPNFVQLYGTASSSGLHAVVFHDDLIPVRQMLEKYRHSPVSTVYFWGYLVCMHHTISSPFTPISSQEDEFGDAYNYFHSVSGTGLYYVECTM